VLGRATGKLGFTRLTTARTWGGHHLPPYNIFCASPHGPHPNGILSRNSQMGVPKFPKLEVPQLWGPINYSPHWELSNNMSHTTCTWRNRVDSWLLVVGNQTTNLTPDLFFGHNLCFRCPNGSCEPILDIYVFIALQWYKELFKLIGFDPYNRPLKIRESIGTLTPKMGVHLGVWGFIPSHSFALPGTLYVIPKLPSWLATLQTLTLVASPRLGLW
jgi:hypothetical protein